MKLHLEEEHPELESVSEFSGYVVKCRIEKGDFIEKAVVFWGSL